MLYRFMLYRFMLYRFILYRYYIGLYYKNIINFYDINFYDIYFLYRKIYITKLKLLNIENNDFKIYTFIHFLVKIFVICVKDIDIIALLLNNFY